MYRNVLASTIVCLMMATMAFSQATSLGGTVTDQSAALLPGVSITVTNTATGVETKTITNEVGSYNFASLQPGTSYRVTASLPGFQVTTVTDLSLGAGVAVRQNFQLQVSPTSTTVEVSAARSNAVNEVSASVGDVLTRDRIQNLPLVGNNVLDLLNILPGVRYSGLGEYANTVAGMGLNTLNVTLDGLPLRDERFSAQAGTFQGVDLETGGISPAFGFFGPGVISEFTGGNRLLATTTINPDLVGEIRLILSPVDAELGRGNSQVQITTRSGTNRYTGSAVWNIQNTALNPNTWDNNNNVDAITGLWRPTQPDWRNTHQYTLSYGGPIFRNKTFFYVLWDQQISNTRAIQTNQVLTPTARNGVFRFWEGWNPGAADIVTSAISAAAANPTIASVDYQGKPLVPFRWPNGAAYDGSQAGVPAGSMRCFSIFGTVKADGSPFGAADCPGGTDALGRSYNGVPLLPPGGALLWDGKRPDAAASAAGYFRKLLELMPPANDYSGGGFGPDGLNTGNHRWLLGRNGNNLNDSIVGSEAYSDRKQINIKIDQNWSMHRISANWTHQIDDNTDPAADWPNGLSGRTTRRPHTFTASITSTLSQTLLNEGRFGLNLNKTTAASPWNLPNAQIADAAREFILTGGASRSGNGAVYPVLISPAGGGLSFDGGLMDTAAAQEIGYSNPLYNFADTVSWTRGKHAFKFGGDFRFPRSNGYSLQPYPVAAFGNLGGTTATGSPLSDANQTTALGATGTPTTANPAWASNVFPSTSRGRAAALSYLLTDSLGSITMPYWAENYSEVSAGTAGWQDVTTQDNRHRNLVYSDFAIFAKDDYKLTKDITLNLGVRYEYYAPPYITSGLTSAPVDQGLGLFGMGRGVGSGFENWLRPGNLYLTGYGTNPVGTPVSLSCQSGVQQSALLPVSNCDPSKVTDIEFIGPNSPNLGKTIIPRDRNNFGPAVGFAWQLPWFGAGRTTVRGGYQVTFQRVSIPEGTLASALGGSLTQNAGQNDPAVQAISSQRALLLSDLPSLVPLPPSRAPGQTVPIYSRSQSFTGYDPNYATPYTQNLTLSVTRSLSRTFTLDVRYVGNLSRKQSGSLNLNTSTAMYNKELFAAFDEVRKGGNPELLDRMLAGVDLAPGLNSGSNTGFFGNTVLYPTERAYGPIGSCMGNLSAGITAANLPGVPAAPGGDGCPAGTIRQHAGDHLRRATIVATAGPLANGDYVALANFLSGATAPTGGLQALNVPVGGSTPQQRWLRNGCDRIANGLWNPNNPIVYPVLDSNVTTQRDNIPGTVASNIPTTCFPENYVIANPQLSSATYNTNLGRSNYHSMQVQMTMRPVAGTSFQGTWTWAKSMRIPTSGYTDPLQRNLDRAAGTEQAHTYRMNGTFEVPIGPNKFLLGNTSGWVARLIENWQTSIILNLATGTPNSIFGAGNMRYGNGRYVATEWYTPPTGKVEWNGPNGTGTYFGTTGPGQIGSYVNVPDPQCQDASSIVQTDVRGFAFASSQFGCTLRALAMRAPANTPGSFLLNPTDPNSDSAVYVLVNPKPGEYGTLGPGQFTGFGQFSLDANAAKRFRLTESKTLSLRIDATNVLNHPQPGQPNFFVNAAFGELGAITTKSGNRTFQGQVRLSF